MWLWASQSASLSTSAEWGDDDGVYLLRLPRGLNEYVRFSGEVLCASLATAVPSDVWSTGQRPSCCRKGDPFQGPKLGSCLTPGNELSEETHADKARDFIGKGHLGGEQ